MWSLREKEAPGRLSPVLITVNLQKHLHQKYHPGIFLFTSCRSSSVTFNLCKYLPFEKSWFLSSFSLQITSALLLHILLSSFFQPLTNNCWVGLSQPCSPSHSSSFLQYWGLPALPWRATILGGQGCHRHVPSCVLCIQKTNQNLPNWMV